MQRLPLETNYFEAYNRDNVHLVVSPRRRSSGSRRTASRPRVAHHDLDVIVYATGFDAITGGFDRIDIRGVGGQSLRDKWRDSPSTYLGLSSPTGSPIC
jgi:cation diffusion facilitator CzcD-associated flavoprotein CzcO